MDARSAVCFLLVLVLLGTPASAWQCEKISTKDLFCIKYLCRGFCHDEAVNLRGKNARVTRAWCTGRSTLGRLHKKDFILDYSGRLRNQLKNFEKWEASREMFISSDDRKALVQLSAADEICDYLAPGQCESETDFMPSCSEKLCKWSCELVVMRRGGHLVSYECDDGAQYCNCIFCENING
ncbi:hypothetical protein GUJ93_ZPchr0012g21712 [Zizania palustris]|uniref:Uncharacterized protein n=1 Tax=Zizania palustris TaxID=103762 RepID=A0A8J5WMA4_ZIZPA|nr:hypothetical protein GUJ93_ZPchr0012g21712 [Zizania palustris]